MIGKMCPQEVADKRQVATPIAPLARPNERSGVEEAPESTTTTSPTTTAATRGAPTEHLEDVKRHSNKKHNKINEEEEKEKEVIEKPRVVAHSDHVTRPEEANHSVNINKLLETTRNKMHNKTSRTQKKLVTNLVSAATEGKVELVRLLLRCGADVNGQDDELGNTALHQAAWNGFSETVQLLCRHRANTSIRNKAQFTPLHMACQQGHNQSARLLLMANSKTEAKNSYGDTPLHTAARYGHAGVARILLSAKSNPNQVNKNHDTPLHIAAAMGRRKLTKIFMQHGAEPAIKNKQSETAMDIALRKDLIDIQELIANPPPLKASSSSSSSLRQRLRSLGTTVGSCGQLYGSGLNRLQSQPPKRNSKVSQNDVRLSSEDAISCELEHRLGQLAIRSHTCRLETQPPREALNGAFSSQHSLQQQHHQQKLQKKPAIAKLHCNGTKPQAPKCRQRCKTLTSTGDLHLLLAGPSSGDGFKERLPKASGKEESLVQLEQRRIRGGCDAGSGSFDVFAGPTISGASSDQLAPDARSPPPHNELLARPLEAAANGGSMAPVACEEEAGNKKSNSPGGSIQSCSTISRRSGGGVSRRHQKTSLLVRRPNAVGTCVAKLLLLKPKHQKPLHQLVRPSLPSSQASHCKRDETSSKEEQQACAQDKPLAGRRQERLDKMHQLSAGPSAMQQVPRAPNGSRLQATRPLAALSDETQLYAIPKKSKTKQQVSSSHDTSSTRANQPSDTPSPLGAHQVGDEPGSRQQLVGAGSDGPALTSDGCPSLTDSTGGSYDGLSLSGEPADTKISVGHDLDSQPCLCSPKGSFETKQSHSREGQQVASTTGHARPGDSIFQLGVAARNPLEMHDGFNELVERQIEAGKEEEERTQFASLAMIVKSDLATKEAEQSTVGAEKEQLLNEKKPGKRSFWSKSRFSLARSRTGSQLSKNAKGAVSMASNNARIKVESSQLDESDARAHEELASVQQLIQMSKQKQSPTTIGKMSADCTGEQLANSRPKNGLLLSSSSTELIAAQRSLATAAAAKVKRDRLARLLVGQQQQQTTTTATAQEHSPATGVPNLSHGVLTVKTAGDSFGWPTGASLNQSGLSQKYLLSATTNGQSHRSGSNSVGMSDSSPSNNGADSDNSLHTTTGSLNTDNTSGEHQPPNSASSSSSPLGMLSRILLNNKNYSNLMQQAPTGSPSSCDSNSPSTNQTGAAKKLEQLVSRSRQPIVVAKSNELTDDATDASSSAGPPLPSKSALKPSSIRWDQRPAAMVSTVSSEHMNGLPRVSSYTHISSAPSQHQDSQQRPPTQQAAYKKLCGFHSGAHTQPSYMAQYHFRSAYPDRQQHHLSHNDLGALCSAEDGCELNLPASAINYEYYLNGGLTEVPLVSSLYQPGYLYCPPANHHQLQSQYTLQNHQDDSIYIPAYTLHDSQHRDADLTVPETGPEPITPRLSATALKQQQQRPKSSLDSVHMSAGGSTCSPLFYNPQTSNGQNRLYSANYNNSPSSVGANSDAASSGPVMLLREGGAGGQLARLQMSNVGSKVNKLNLDSYITNVPPNNPHLSRIHANGKIPPAYYHGLSSASGTCLDTSTDTMSTVSSQTAPQFGGLPASSLYSNENSIYAANRTTSLHGSDLTVLPTADSSSKLQQQHQAILPTTSPSTNGKPQTGGNLMRDNEIEVQQGNSHRNSLEAKSSLTTMTSAAKLHKSLVQVNQSTPTEQQLAQSHHSCTSQQQLSPPADSSSSSSDCNRGQVPAIIGDGNDLQAPDDAAAYKGGSSVGASNVTNNVNRSSVIQNKLLTTSMKSGHTKLIISSNGMQLETSVKMGDDKLIKQPALIGMDSAMKPAGGSYTGSTVI